MYADRLQPHDMEAEESVLGSFLIDSEAILTVVGWLKPEFFFRDRNRYVMQACLTLFQRGEAINQVTVAHQLNVDKRLDDVGGPAYLSHLVAAVPTSLHVEHFARIVTRCATMRRLAAAAADIAAIAYEGSDDPDAVVRRAEDILYRVRDGDAMTDFRSLKDILSDYLEQRATGLDADGATSNVVPIPSGFDALDELLGGMHRSDLLILAARPSLGKSTLAMNIAVNAARHGNRVGVVSMEMSRDQLALRLVASKAEVDSHRIRLGLVTRDEDDRIEAAVADLADLPLWINDHGTQSIASLRSQVRRLSLTQGLDFLVVDYLQLMRGESVQRDNRVQEVTDITRALKALARDLNIPILALSQLSRAVEQRVSHRPQLSDLRESGSIEQDADVVMFIYRPDLNGEEGAVAGGAELIVAKHRSGPVGSVPLLFQGWLARFESVPVGSVR